jgi:hypothetical protein
MSWERKKVRINGKSYDVDIDDFSDEVNENGGCLYGLLDCLVTFVVGAVGVGIIFGLFYLLSIILK